LSSAPSATPSTDVLTLFVGGKALSGWQTVSITCGIEIMPTSFAISLTELYPTEATEAVIQPGQSCVLKIGDDVILTGYIDRYRSTVSATGHTVIASGRGKCQDLVDCSAGIKPDGSFAMQINAATALQLASDLSAPFEITASLVGLTNGNPIPRFMINFGETPFEIIDRIARYSAVLAYEGTDGNLILSSVGTSTMASGFTVPGSVEESDVSYAMDQRFSDYYVLWNSIDPTMQIPSGVAVANGNLAAHVNDQTMPRFRPRAMVSEQMQSGQSLGQQRAAWEMNRRNGRAQAVRLTCDSWRDTGGTLWNPNALAPVDIPISKLSGQTWLISEVTFRRDEQGTHADITLMPPAAFTPEPTVLQGIDWQVQQALPNAATSTGPAITAPFKSTGPDTSSIG
jgi:prophage tail gpP-like protein